MSDGAVSDSAPFSSGVSQVTVLAPLLFLLYTNDLPLATSNSSPRLFTDDSLIFQPIYAEDDCRLL